jgi:cytochrome c-type biogenesis protein CcsB
MWNVLSELAIVFYSVAEIYFVIIFLSKKSKTRTVAFLFLLLGIATHGFYLLVFGLDQHRIPAANLIETFSLVAWVMLAFFAIISRRDSMEAMGVILIPIAILSLIANAITRGNAAGVEPLLRGGWIYIHIPLVILSMASLSIAFVSSLMYLIQERQLKSKHPAFFYHRLPSLEVCDDVSYKSLWAGFFLLTLGILTGMVWSKYLRGVYWSWDYKEVWSLITWALYALLLHGRMVASWRGRKAAYWAIVGFALMLFTFIGATTIFQNYHPY